MKPGFDKVLEAARRREWYERKAKAEADHEIAAGASSRQLIAQGAPPPATSETEEEGL